MAEPNTFKPTVIFDPNARLDYGFGFANLIDSGDVIVSCEFAVCVGNPGGEPITGAQLTLGVIDAESSTVWAWFTVTDESLVNKTIAGTCRYTTAEGRSDDRTIYFLIRNR